jgi:superfamily II DNA helicase RecQ
MLAIDEAHEVHQSGRNFRPEFFDAVENMKNLYDVLPRPVPRLVMSATMTSEDIDVVTKKFGIDRYVMMCGSLARRQTLFRFKVSGNPAKSVVQLGADKLAAQPDKQQLWYCNSRTSAEGSMLDKAEGLLEKHFNSGKSQSTAQSFTGGDGLKMKVSIMDAFTSFADLPGEPVWNADGTVTLAKIQILIATSAANCGISSNFLTTAMHKGLPYSLYDIVQEMGRVNRTQRIPNCSFEIHASFDCLLSTYIRIMSNKDATERSRLLDMLMEVLQFLVVPDTCYHSFVEQYFEHGDIASTEKADCGNMCSACLKETTGFTGTFYCSQLISVLSNTLLNKPHVGPDSLKNAIKLAKRKIFHPGHVPGSNTAPIHALLLQMVAKNILKISVGNTSVVGTQRIAKKHLIIQLSSGMRSDGVIMPSYLIDESWNGMTYDDSTEPQTLE